MRKDTIVAPATAAGVSGLAIVRLSGPKTFAVLSRLLPGDRVSSQPSYTARLVWLKDEKGEPVDQVMVTVFRKPRSYTGEDMAEITCHGSPFIYNKITELCQKLGCRLAEPGEFTQRAVLNGKLTLSQAEAIWALVNATNPLGHRTAIKAYQGATSRQIAELAEMLRDLHSDVEYLLGFDENEAVDTKSLDSKTKNILVQLTQMVRDVERSRFLFEPARVAIVGRTNVGKSSLFNRLLGNNRAITSSIPNTTRDRIEASLSLGNLRVNLIDTCGFRVETEDPLARKGTTETKKAIQDADLLAIVFDGSHTPRKDDWEIITATEKKPKIFVINKSDLTCRFDPRFLPGRAIRVSCKTGYNINRVRAALIRHLQPRSLSSPLITLRQIEIITECRNHLMASLASQNLETRAQEIKSALEALGKIDSPLETDDILNRIFARFCIGK
ncbi:MAG: tRNA uridine-5-carboxymethylaminomethyl(34) synthesis GTPase MnmE [candidate division WOR-3 bacterium]